MEPQNINASSSFKRLVIS